MSILKKTIEEIVNRYPTKNKVGFTSKEIDELLLKYNIPITNKNKFDEALSGITCQMINDEIVIYHCDIVNAIMCGIENRDMKAYEWD